MTDYEVRNNTPRLLGNVQLGMAWMHRVRIQPFHASSGHERSSTECTTGNLKPWRAHHDQDRSRVISATHTKVLRCRHNARQVSCGTVRNGIAALRSAFHPSGNYILVGSYHDAVLTFRDRIYATSRARVTKCKTLKQMLLCVSSEGLGGLQYRD